ncbi:signal recognition particle receptor subunit alpha [Thecamonas trahens ATCC 50062]|uniref:Signal recognition particle receptor subunit alpha n=1 Tax=Thecamonas trahens ATCC 50062 TaxID=461836 RepID=A0A0L0D2I5_THETB|nr:signal recognition particle receptor subunit alpha [Thecamonas trahens ATCC 50062]KNC46512.1 signal recognition particle receptor subunit alpha [Thecamonas trahens ATCC 50062]|eukprot:XP_013760293.1 signal recognition particle receptor subunit alpha [Thecamonas trahens ATCC 50062]
MLDNFTIVNRGGLCLYSYQPSASVFHGVGLHPVDALISNVLLEGHASSAASPYIVGSFACKWHLDNNVGLVYVAVYRHAFPIRYVDDLLDSVPAAFESHYSAAASKPKAPSPTNIDDFDETFKDLLLRAETAAEAAKRAGKAGKANKGKASEGKASKAKTSHAKGKAEALPDADEAAGDEASGDGDGGDGDGGDVPDGKPMTPAEKRKAAMARLKARKGGKGGKGSKGGRGKGGKASRGKEASSPAVSTKKRGKVMRTKNKLSKADEEALAASLAMNADGSSASARKQALAREADEEALDIEVVKGGVALGDIADELSSSSEGGPDPLEDGDDAGSSSKPKATTGLFSLFQTLTGNKTLAEEDLEPVMAALAQRLEERNVASEVAHALTESVASNLIGQTLPSMTSVKYAAKQALTEALTRILTPRRKIDVIREAHAAREAGKVYSIVMMGVNGVGKSTSLSKICYWLRQNGFSVLIAACDTFRSGAISQLQTHGKRLGVDVYEQGYGGDPAAVAKAAIGRAVREGIDVVLIDTAGRMVKNSPLMKALAKLVEVNLPDLILFVGEALVGNDGVDQLMGFRQALIDHGTTSRNIDGIVLSKFDSVDDKVGASVSMVHASGGIPIVLVGTGQNYTDIKGFSVKGVVKALMK